MSLLSMCRTSGTLKRPTNSKDASGGMVVDPFVVIAGYDGVACDIQPATGSIRFQYMQQQLNVSHTVFTASEIPAKPGDVWVSGARTFQFRGREMPAPGYGQWPAKMHVEEQLG